MATTLIAVWLIMYGTLSLVATKVPEWIVPVTAVVVGLVALTGVGWWKKN